MCRGGREVDDTVCNRLRPRRALEGLTVSLWSGMLEAHTPPGEMVPKLAAILEEEAETFVVKLWRMLVFEVQRYEVENAPEEEEEKEEEGFSLLSALQS